MGHCWMSLAPYSFLHSSHVRERDKALSRSVMALVVSGLGVFYLAGLGVSLFLVDSVVLQMVMDTFFGGMYLSS